MVVRMAAIEQPLAEIEFEGEGQGAVEKDQRGGQSHLPVGELEIGGLA